jgi:hypothetical protein
MNREQVAGAAGDLVLRLRTLLGEESGSEDEEGAADADAAGQEGSNGTANGNAAEGH